MGKAIGKIYKYSQCQPSTMSIRKPIISSLAAQTSSSTTITRTLVSSIIDKKESNSVLCSQNTIQNDLNITNNEKCSPVKHQ